MSASTTTLHCRVITYETSLSFDEVTARLHDAINREQSSSVLSRVGQAMDKNTIDALLPSDGFIFFNEFAHHKWLNAYHGVTNTPRTSVYVIGNPRIADTMLKHDLRAALHIPPRLLVMENDDRTRTSVLYHQPSSAIALPGCSQVLRAAAHALDAKLEALVAHITHAPRKGNAM
ncbi:hypothetical protein HDZ31DRAFT_49033 [Schizophyllum fasciatum]